jgi:hypothetical protein
MPRPRQVTAVRSPLDFTQAMSRLCHDITNRHEAFAHIDMSRVAVCFTQTRSKVLHGLQAKLTPMRFENGALTCIRHGRPWTVQRLFIERREMSYILTFYLPRFLDQTFNEKFITILHELYHISPLFNGDIRRFSGRCHIHSASQQEYDGQMELYAKEYLAMNPPRELYSFLEMDFKTILQKHGGVIGLQVPIPKLIPLDQVKTA